jgi:hypothetical protein
MTDFFELFWENSYEINASVRATLRARLLLPPIDNKPANQFRPSMKEAGSYPYFKVPDGIVAHLTRECGGNMHDHQVVKVTSGSFEKETHGTHPHSEAYDNDPRWAAKNAADLETHSCFCSAYRGNREDIPHTRNNWVCYDFKERRIAPTHYAICTNWRDPGCSHLKSWLVEMSADGESWRDVAREEDNWQLKGERVTGTFPVARG